MATLVTVFVAQACGNSADGDTSSVGAMPASSAPSTTSVATITTTTAQPPTTTTATSTTTTTTTTSPPTTTTTQPPPAGSAIYSDHCAACHGDDLEGGVGPALGPEGHAENHDDEELLSIIASGKADMPAFGDTLSPDEILSVIAHLREVQGIGHNE